MLMLTAFLGCKEDEDQIYDINWPVPEITGISPEQQMIGDNLTITGNEFTKITRIWVGGVEITEENVVSKSETEIVVKVPRAAGLGPVELENVYEKRDVSETNFTPAYPVTTVANGPASLERGSPFRLTGENVDLITRVQVGSDVVEVDGSTGSASSVSIQTSGVDLSADMVTITVIAAKGGLEGNATFIDVPVVNPGAFFEAAEPIVLWDFEDGVNPYGGEGISSINGGDIPKGMGANYLHIEASNPDKWYTYGLITATEVDPGAAEFHDPHISFLINTGDAEGYFHMQVIQGATTYEAHFNNAPDDYKFKTDGWEWRSYTLNPSSPDAGEWKPRDIEFDPMQPFTMQLEVRNGNIESGDFEVNVDQIMITDGPVAPVAVESFEDYSPSFGSINGGAVEAYHLDKYFHHSFTASGSWSFQGGVRLEGPLNLGDLQQPFLSFWINTGSGTAFFQLETAQNGSKFGHDPNAYELYDTGGEWELITINLNEISWTTWEGDGTFDPGAVSDYFSINFTSGNQESGLYEFNLDGLTLSEGPMF